jgi:hypothetical protein
VGKAALPVPLEDEQVVAIAAGQDDVCAATASGRVRCWGASKILADQAPQEIFEKLTGYGEFFCGTRGEGGPTFCWGPDSLEDVTNKGGLVKFDETVTRPSAGSSEMINGQETVCAIAAEGKQVHCLSEDEASERSFDQGIEAFRLSVGGALACVIDTDFHLSCVSTAQSSSQYTEVPEAPDGENIIQVQATYNHACAMTDMGNLACWGTSGYGQTDVPDWSFE